MEKICDLHVHSTCSDGTVTPAGLIALAKQMNVGALALCDHNTVAGLPEFLEAAAHSGIEAIAGVEFSTDYRGAELHVLGLFVQSSHFAAVTGKLTQMREAKEESNLDLIAGLQRAGIDLDYEKLKAGTGGGSVNRAVIAAEMVRLGHCGSVKEAFGTWLDEKHGYFHPPKRPDVFETIRFIKSIGAAAVLAHPFLNLQEASLREFLPCAARAGLDGMEVWYPKFSPEQTVLAAALAEEFGLLPSGGSDFHGANKPDICLGTGKNCNLKIPCEVAKRLQIAAKRTCKKANAGKFAGNEYFSGNSAKNLL